MSIEVMERKKGRIYYARVFKNGRRYCRSFNRYYDAQKFCKDTELNEALVDFTRYTFKQAAEEWIKYATLRKGASGIMNDRANLKNNILPCLANLKLHNIAPQHIESCLYEMQKRGLTNSTLNRNLDVIRAILNYFQKRGAIYHNPVSAIERPKIEPKIFSFWNGQEIRVFLEYTKQKYWDTPQYATFLFYMIALNCGLRQGEALALKWSDIDFEIDTITVSKTFSGHTRKIKNSTKSHKIRYVPINMSLRRVLEEARSRRGGSGLVLTWSGTVIDPHNLRQRYFQKDIKESGVTPIRIHDMRHTFASHFAMNGGDLYALQRILGHSTIRMTERYAHFSQAFLKDKANIVNFSTEDNVIKVDFQKEAMGQ